MYTLGAWVKECHHGVTHAAENLGKLYDPGDMLRGLVMLFTNIADNQEVCGREYLNVKKYYAIVVMIVKRMLLELERIPPCDRHYVLQLLRYHICTADPFNRSIKDTVEYYASSFRTIDRSVDLLFRDLEEAVENGEENAIYKLEQIMDYATCPPKLRKTRIHRWLRLRGVKVAVQPAWKGKRKRSDGKRFIDHDWRKTLMALLNESFRTEVCYKIRLDFSRLQRSHFQLGVLGTLYFIYKIIEIRADKYDRNFIEPSRASIVRDYLPDAYRVVSSYLVQYEPASIVDRLSNLMCNHRCVTPDGMQYFCSRHAAGRERRCGNHN